MRSITVDVLGFRDFAEKLRRTLQTSKVRMWIKSLRAEIDDRYRMTTNVDYGEVDQHLSSITRVAYDLLILPDVIFTLTRSRLKLMIAMVVESTAPYIAMIAGMISGFGHSPNNAEAA